MTLHPPSDDADRRSLELAATGDRAAFAALFRRHHQRLLRFLTRMSQRRDLVDEVINDTMWIVWRKCGEFRGESKASTWITGIAYRCMLKALRDRVTRHPLESWDDHVDQGGEEAPDDTAPGSADDVELRDWLNAGLRLLSEDQRLTMQLVYVMGETCEDVAAIMGCATGTVKARLFHARMRMRNLLPDLGEPHHHTSAWGQNR